MEGLGQVPNFLKSRLALYPIWEEGGEERESVKVKRRRKGEEKKGGEGEEKERRGRRRGEEKEDGEEERRGMRGGGE